MFILLLPLASWVQRVHKLVAKLVAVLANLVLMEMHFPNWPPTPPLPPPPQSNQNCFSVVFL